MNENLTFISQMNEVYLDNFFFLVFSLRLYMQATQHSPPPKKLFYKSAHLTDGKDAADAIVAPVGVQRCPPAPHG